MGVLGAALRPAFRADRAGVQYAVLRARGGEPGKEIAPSRQGGRKPVWKAKREKGKRRAARGVMRDGGRFFDSPSLIREEEFSLGALLPSAVRIAPGSGEQTALA